ncbi:MAG: hypothetical protein RL286_712, partial [Bacteroidota bacterium]
MKIRLVPGLLFWAITFCHFAQNSLFIRQIYDEALLRGEAYENLRQLCKQIGPRLSGSAEAEMAVNWSYEKMNAYHFDRVTKQA